MKYLSPVIAFTVIVSAISMAIAYTRSIAPRENASAPRAQDLPQQQPTPQTQTFPLNSYLATGFPVAISNAVVISQKVAGEKKDRPATARFTVANRDTGRINSLSLTLFSFQGAAKLTRVDSWIRPVGLDPGSSTEISFDLERRVTPADKLLLAVERLNSISATRSVSFLDLAVNAATAAAGNRPPDTKVDQAPRPLPDDSGAALCSNGFRRAMSLAKSGDKASVTSFTCNQAGRSFAFTFSSKTLSK